MNPFFNSKQLNSNQLKIKQKNLKIQNRISFRISIIFGLTLLISTLVIGYYGYNNATNAYLENSINRTEENISKLSSILKGFIQPSISDLKFLTDFYGLKRFVQWRDLGERDKQQRWKEVTVDAFSSFLISKKRYSQIRYINSQGQEMLRLDYNIKTNKVHLSQINELQNKGHWDYFKKTMKLIGGTVYVSPFNLNRENGKIVIPYQPTIRFSMAMIDKQEQRRGMVVINMIGNQILEKFEIHDKSDRIGDVLKADKYFLVNKEGYYLYIKDQNLRFGFDLGNRISIAKDHPVLFQAISANEVGNLIENDNIVSFQRIYPSGHKDENYMVAINLTPQAIALEKLRDFEQAFIILVIIIFIGLLFIIRWISQILSPLNQVSQQLSLLSEGIIPSKNKESKNKDEVALIVNSSNQLIDNVQLTIDQANAIAQGDFSKQISVRSAADELNTALNSMTKRLADIAELATSLSRGEYSQTFESLNDSDSLGIALKEMFIYLLEISKVAESIALGDFNYPYKLASKDDRLGLAVTQMQVNLRAVVSQANAITSGNFNQSINPKSDKDELGKALLKMTEILASTKEKNSNILWLNDGLNTLSKKLSDIDEPVALAQESIRIATKYIAGAAGVLYIYNDKTKFLELKASYAFSHRENLNQRFKIGDSVIGQVALEMSPILLAHSRSEKQSDSLNSINTGLHQFEPLQTYTFPIIDENILFGVAEIALMKAITPIQEDYLLQAAKVFAKVLKNSIQSRQIKDLLDKSQHDFEELQMKSEELQQTNVQMEEQAQQLKMQTDDIKKQNLSLTEAKKDLDKQAKELKQTSQYKSEFLANMSHELRTPLNSIILLSKMLRDGLDDIKQSKKAAVIYSAGNDLLLLINDILDLSKVEAGQMELDIEEVSSAQLGLSLEELFNPIAEEKQLKFNVIDELNCDLKIDRTKMTQVLKNLLSNAFKFTKQGNVTLRLYAQGQHINFAVSDTGIGIPEDKLEHIFKAFKQVDGSITREYGGTGLGLSISLNFSQLMGGELIAQSVQGQGSTFTLSLLEKEIIIRNIKSPADLLTNNSLASSSVKDAPFIDNARLHTTIESQQKEFQQNSMTTASSYAIEEEIDNPIETNFEGNTLLLVDDDSRNIFTLSVLFQELGAQILHALDGQEALDLINDKGDIIDLVLIDIMMPKMDGYETITKIRQDKKYQSLPIIAVTAKAMEEDRQKCLDVGANDYLTKPINEQTLVQLSRLWIDKSQN